MPGYEVPPAIRKALNATGHQWTARLGRRHCLIRANGQLIVSLSYGTPDSAKINMTVNSIQKWARRNPVEKT